MSEDMYRRQLNGYARKQAGLSKKRADEMKRAADVTRDISRIMRSLNSSSSMSTSSRNSKLRQVSDKQAELAGHEKKVADYERDHARVGEQIASAQRNLDRAVKSRQDKEEREAKRQRDLQVKHQTEMEKRRRRDVDEAERRRRAEVAHERALTSEVSRRERMFSPTVQISYVERLPERVSALLVAANPQDQTHLLLDEEVRDVTNRIQSSRYGRSIDLKSIWAVRPGDLMEALNEHEPRIVHFSGHGSDRDEIVFLDREGNSKLVSKEAIAATIATTADHVRLVVFNTCYSRSQAEAVTEHVDAAIGMRRAIGDEAARVFATGLYSAIGHGYSVARAFEKARAEVMLEGIDEEDTPELFVRQGVDADSIVLVRPGDFGIGQAA